MADRQAATARTAHADLDWIRDDACLVSGKGGTKVAGADLKRHGVALATALRRSFPPGSVIGSIADNSPSWLQADLALQAAGMIHVPLPTFFSAEQIAHAVRATSMAALFCSRPSSAARLGFSEPVTGIACEQLGDLRCFGRPQREHAVREAPVLPSVTKVTFTSGTTGTPKGVLLCIEQQLATARSIAAVTAELAICRHMCLLPLPVLLENVAGAYTSLMTGATCIAPSLDAVGMQGASAFDARRCLEKIAAERVDSIMLLPQMLAALVTALETESRGRPTLAHLKFVAVGGGRTSPLLIMRARRLGLPVYEGYGLSECASVVTLNLPSADRLGSVGRPLPGVSVRLADDGEIEVQGRGFEGSLGTDAPAAHGWLATGDLGRIDADGYVCIVGRKKNVLVTSYGRNVSPEWPEGALTECPGIRQAAVFGDARPYLCAVIVAASGTTDEGIAAGIQLANRRLPDYARIGAWTRAHAPFTADNGLSTANGRNRPAAIEARYRDAIDALYDDAAPDRSIHHALPAPC